MYELATLIFSDWAHLLTSSSWLPGMELYTNIDFLESSTNLNPSVTNTCRQKILQWTHGSLATRVHGPARSSKPP